MLLILISQLEREIGSYKSRLDELRKAKNNLIIKKTTEYVKTGSPALGYNYIKSKRIQFELLFNFNFRLSREKNSSPENEQTEQVAKNTDNTNNEVIINKYYYILGYVIIWLINCPIKQEHPCFK